jgi:serine/threonine-protein kinase
MFDPGQLVDDKYRIVRKIGEGGMGAVFEAEAVRIHRRVAIKVLFADRGESDIAARFQLEAQAAGRIGSPHIVEVIDLGVLPSGSHYMVMEFLAGESLRSRIASCGRLTALELYPIALQLLEGLGAAHAAGVVHRDLKPDNVFLVKKADGTDFVKLLDFGISKFNSLNDTGSALSLTRTGAMLGTPYYMSPEQASGAKIIDHRADVYGVGVILYEALTGVVPFTADTFNELMFKIVLQQPKPILEVVPHADPGFVAIVERAMAREPQQRFQSTAEILAALELWRRDETPLTVDYASLRDKSRFEATQAAPVPRLSVPTNTPSIWASSGAHDRLAAEPERRPRRHLVQLGAASVVLLGAIAGGVLLLSKKEPAPNTTQPAIEVSQAAQKSPENPLSSTVEPVDSSASRNAAAPQLAPSATVTVNPATSTTAEMNSVKSTQNHSRPTSLPRTQRAAPNANRAAATTSAAPEPPAEATAKSETVPTPPPNDVSRIRNGRPIRSDL